APEYLALQRDQPPLRRMARRLYPEEPRSGIGIDNKRRRRRKSSQPRGLQNSEAIHVNGLYRNGARNGNGGDLIYYVHSLGDLAKYRIIPVQVVIVSEVYVELTSCGIGTGMGHGQGASPIL